MRSGAPEPESGPVIALALALVLGLPAGCLLPRRPEPPVTRPPVSHAALDLEAGRRYLGLDHRRASRHLYRALRASRAGEDREGEADALGALGRMHLLEKQYEIATEFFEKAIAGGWASGEALVFYGEALVAAGRHDVAVGVLESALRPGSTRVERAAVWLHLARAYQALGRLARSRDAAERSLRLHASAEGRRVLVDVLIELGHRAKAFEVSQGVPLGFVQDVLLETDTRLLVYASGDDASLLWEVTPAWLRAHHLPPGRELDRLARDARRQLLGRDETSRGAVADAASALIGPIEDLRRDERLVVVSEGDLSALPFAALPIDAGGAPLVSLHEIVRLTSLSELSALRARSRRHYTRWVAVAADPSYGLPGARREARAIETLAPRGMVEVVTGRDASVEWLLGAADGFRILHLAAHGTAERGIVLGNAFVGSETLGGVDLVAETVVLSACPSNLTSAFLDSGARRVVASHWSVDDEATAELMRGFYSRMFSGLSPGSALRGAQIAMWKRSRFRSPRYWAAFELYGDWT